MRTVVILAALAIVSPARAYECPETIPAGCDPFSGYLMVASGTISSIVLLQSGVNKPAVVSHDYHRAVCDVAKIMNRSTGWTSVTLDYDDGMVSFDCKLESDR